MSRRGTLGAIAAVVCATVLSSCATTVMTGSWVDPTYTSGPFKKVMIVGVAKREAVRLMFEDAFAAQLRAHGVEAIPSGTVLPGTQQLDDKAMASKLAELGCDGVIVTRLLDKRTRTTVYPPTGYVVPVGYYGGYYSYYRGAYAMMYSPGYVEQTTIASLETNLYDARTGRLVWSGMTDTDVIGDPTAQINEFVKVLTGKMAEAKLIQ
jgi:hypothetical protein